MCFFPLLVISAWGQSESPFEPPGSGDSKKGPTIAPITKKPVPTTAISSEIELRGYFKLGDDYYFSIHQKKVDPKAKRKKSWRKNSNTPKDS